LLIVGNSPGQPNINAHSFEVLQACCVIQDRLDLLIVPTLRRGNIISDVLASRLATLEPFDMAQDGD